MAKHDPIATLTPDMVLDSYDGYPEEVLACEWNPALNQVLRLRKSRRKPAAVQPLFAHHREQPK